MAIMLRNFLILLYVSLVWASSLEGVPFKPVKDLGPRIINGDRAVLGQFPWQVAIEVQQSSIYGLFCGGAIINEEWILTAGQCLVDGTSATVTVGSVRIPNSANQYSSAELILHEDYDPKTLANDIGLIRLSKKLTFDDNVQAIDLPSKPLGDGVNITVAGWGVTHDAATTTSRNLNYITIKTITNQACGQIYGQGFVLADMVCAKNIANSLQSPCKGDAGGPAVTDATSTPVHVAISSFIHRNGCEIGLPVGFTRTYAYIDWIKSKLDQSDQPDQTDRPDQSGGNGADLTKFSWVPSLITVIVITIIIPS